MSPPCPPSCEQRPRSHVLADPVRADRHRSGRGSQAEHSQQHLRRLPETRPPGAEVFGGRQALPSQLFQVSAPFLLISRVVRPHLLSLRLTPSLWVWPPNNLKT